MGLKAMLERGPTEAPLLPPPAPPEAFSWTAWLLILLLLPAAWCLLRSFQNSRRGRLRRLRRELRHGGITPRRGAHALALLLRGTSIDNNTLRQTLDKTRFRREEPSREEILDLMRKAEALLKGDQKINEVSQNPRSL